MGDFFYVAFTILVSCDELDVWKSGVNNMRKKKEREKEGLQPRRKIGVSRHTEMKLDVIEKGIITIVEIHKCKIGMVCFSIDLFLCKLRPEIVVDFPFFFSFYM